MAIRQDWRCAEATRPQRERDGRSFTLDQLESQSWSLVGRSLDIRRDPDPVDAPTVGRHVIGNRSEQQPAFAIRETFPAQHCPGGGFTDHRDVGAPANEIDERLGGAGRLAARQHVNVAFENRPVVLGQDQPHSAGLEKTLPEKFEVELLQGGNARDLIRRG